MRRTEVEERRCAMNRMKIGKASDPLGLLYTCLRLVGISV